VKPSFLDLLARLRQMPGLEGTEPAMDGALVIERQPAAEVVAFDERDAEAAACSVIGDEQPVDTSANDQHVDARADPARDLAFHGGRSCHKRRPVFGNGSYKIAA
jgi:hypothetical protein